MHFLGIVDEEQINLLFNFFLLTCSASLCLGMLCMHSIDIDDHWQKPGQGEDVDSHMFHLLLS